MAAGGRVNSLALMMGRHGEEKPEWVWTDEAVHGEGADVKRKRADSALPTPPRLMDWQYGWESGRGEGGHGIEVRKVDGNY